MSESSNVDFLKRFIGRRAELAQLLRAWRLARRGEPQFMLLLADSGFGKTRLIHEFYARISRLENRRDGGYWPDELDSNPVTLCINPRMSGARAIADIPWLWWGLRWHNPGERNAADAMPCALLSSDAQQALRPHVGPLLKKRLRAEKAKSAAKTVLGVGGMILLNAVLPGAAVLNLVSAVKDGYETLKAGKEWRDVLGDHETIDFAQAQNQLHGEADSAAMGFLSAFLDSSESNAPTVPVILVLDDAQWADSLSLRFVRQLFEQAVKRKWPLLVIATCWETEWKERSSKLSPNIPTSAEPENLNVVLDQLTRALGLKGNAAIHEFSLTRFRRLNELEPMLADAFPGIAGEAREYLLAAAHGNPQQMVDMIKRLQAPTRRNWFEGGSIDLNLTPSGLQKLRELPTGHQDILEERVTRLAEDDPDVFTALTLGSIQGVRFYAELTAAVSERLGRKILRGVSPALALAEDPHNWISNFPGSFPAAEFKEFLGRKLFMGYIPDDEAALAYEALRDLLTQWFRTNRIEELEEKPEIGRLLLRLLSADVAPSEEGWVLRCAVMGRCIDWLYNRWRRSEAVALATELCAWTEPISKKQVVAALDMQACLSLPRALLDAQRYDVSVAFAEAALERNPAPQLSERIALHKTIGKAENARERFEEAVHAFQLAIALTTKLPAAESNFAGRLTRLHRALGGVFVSLAKHRAAFHEYKKALRTLSGGGRELPGSPTELRIGAQILAQISPELYHSGKLILAVRVLHRALQLFESCERVGDATPTLLDQHAQALARMGNYHLRNIGGSPEQSERFFQRALRLRQRITSWSGETPAVLSDLAASHSLHAAGLMAIGRDRAARDAVDRALQLRREVCTRVGDQVEALRELSLTIVRRADVARDSDPPDLALARASILEALDLRHRIVDRWGAKQDDLRLLHYAWRKGGEIAMLRDECPEALNMLGKARHTLRRLARVAESEAEVRGELSPVFLRERYICSEKVAEAFEACSKHSRARAALRFALWMNFRLRTGFEPSKSSEGDDQRMRERAERLGLDAASIARDGTRFQRPGVSGHNEPNFKKASLPQLN